MITKGAAMASMNRVREGIALVNGAVALARSNGWDELLAGGLTVTSALVAETDPRAGWAASLEAVDIARRTGRRDRLAIAVGNVTYTGFTIGEWDAALAQVQPVVAETDSAPGQRVWLLSNWIILRANRGEDVSAAVAELDEVVRQGGGEAEILGASLDAHANIALATGDLDRAAGLWRGLARDYGSLAPWGFYQASRTAVWQGNIDDLRADIAGVEASGLHGPTVEARLLTMRAGLAALEGNTAESQHLYLAALDAWRALGLVWDEALTGLDMAIVVDSSKPQVELVANSTRQILERLGARPHLARLDAAITEHRPIRGPAVDTKPLMGVRTVAGESVPN